MQDYNDLLLENLLKKYYTTKSPHLIISRRWFFRIRKNTVMLKKPKEHKDGKNRKVYYQIDQIGKNVNFFEKDCVKVLNPSTTSLNTIYFVVRLSDLAELNNLQFHTELGHMIQKLNLKVHRDKCYVVLSIIQIDKDTQYSGDLIVEDDIDLMKKYFINQIAIKKGNYHFNTSGTIYGLGYGPKSNRNEYGHSVCRFANSKYKKIRFFQMSMYSTIINLLLFLYYRCREEKDNE